ncbi:hypothetical protein E2C01_044300 [Portunus trituberculatus]|uniref:Uncharacterized protein n=1 Tax=Portunus trituberculatus TaxID=210409 RepID=A0A5B7FSR8_PORTR|nr:hypothetical protein [Portunus trituberculatus]
MDNVRNHAWSTIHVIEVPCVLLTNTKPNAVVHLDWRETLTSDVKLANVTRTMTVHKIILVWRITVLIHVHKPSVLLEPFASPRVIKGYVSAQQGMEVILQLSVNKRKSQPARVTESAWWAWSAPTINVRIPVSHIFIVDFSRIYN